ncbi:MAG: hypothetical protein ACYTXA_05715 [Nostoc sp.]
MISKTNYNSYNACSTLALELRPRCDTPEQVPEGYQQLEDGSWLSPEAYHQSILKQSQRSLPWDVRRLRNYE